jgi:hypothetical protein
MSKELGRLTISDRENIHLVAAPSHEEMLWRWRVYLPKGSGHHQVCVAPELSCSTQVVEGGHCEPCRSATNRLARK